ncbi:PREDICTED: uncharacterized protein LOC101291331 [Fragaria vesca subsp. vesca]|uniref:uncharacterized protein LOC101291331 n=1 Tax=Fragaria vesca subsp. vesca TaxID=101020 RepID=UPI0002C2FB22|nr:PREDICTED: uncharacterized protein LOC101291331 [Fragaria vesca subsp. vesca]
MVEPPPAIFPWSFLEPISHKGSPSTSNLKFHKPKIFASIVAGSEENQVPISQLASPTVCGDTVFMKINERIYQEQLATCRNNLIGRLLLRKGSIPMKTETLKASLHSLWRPSDPWRLVPIGKGYFDIHFNSETDMRKVWGGGTCTLESGIFRLAQWKPDFKPGDVLPQTHAQVWVRIADLSQEYWHPQLILEIARGVGTPLQLDPATKEQRFGYFDSVDLMGSLPTSIMVEREHHCFPVGIEYENLPSQCSHYGFIGHEKKNCRQLKAKEVPSKRIEQPLTGEQVCTNPEVTPIGTSIEAPMSSDVIVALVDSVVEEAVLELINE